MVPVFIEQLELEGRWNWIHLPWLGFGLEAAHHQTPHFFLVVDKAVGVAHHRQHRVHTGDRVGHDIKMFRRIERHVHARKPAQLPRPLPGAVDDDLAFHIALCGVYADDSAVLDKDACHFNILDHFHAAIACTLGKRHGEISRICLAVAGNPERALQIVGAQYRTQLTRLLRTDDVHFHAKTPGHGRLLSKDLHAVGCLGDINAATLFPTGRKPRLRFERGIQFDAVFAHACHIAIGPHLPDQSGSVPGGAAS